jgi:hypothetical protein
MLIIFPPGDTQTNQTPQRSCWREFAFMLHQLQQAIEPLLLIKNIIADWIDIRKNLAEKPRKRKYQVFECCLY